MRRSNHKTVEYTHQPTTCKYMFTARHYEALAKVCAMALVDPKGDNSVHHTIRIMRDMLEADSSRFKPDLFNKRIKEIVDRLERKE